MVIITAKAMSHLLELFRTTNRLLIPDLAYILNVEENIIEKFFETNDWIDLDLELKDHNLIHKLDGDDTPEDVDIFIQFLNFLQEVIIIIQNQVKYVKIKDLLFFKLVWYFPPYIRDDIISKTIQSLIIKDRNDEPLDLSIDNLMMNLFPKISKPEGEWTLIRNLMKNSGGIMVSRRAVDIMLLIWKWHSFNEEIVQSTTKKVIKLIESDKRKRITEYDLLLSVYSETFQNGLPLLQPEDSQTLMTYIKEIHMNLSLANEFIIEGKPSFYIENGRIVSINTSIFSPVLFQFRALRRLRLFSLTNPECFEQMNINLSAYPLEQLILASENIKSLPGCISNLSKLQLFKIQQSNGAFLITTSKNFSLPRSLTKLDLSHSHITLLPSDFFHHLSSINILDLNENELSDIPEFGESNHLKEIFLQRNHISQLPQFCNLLKEIENIYVMENPLEFIPDWLIDLNTKKFQNYAIPDNEKRILGLIQTFFIGQLPEVNDANDKISNGFVIQDGHIHWIGFSESLPIQISLRKLINDLPRLDFIKIQNQVLKIS